jgi:hypothetical protein
MSCGANNNEGLNNILILKMKENIGTQMTKFEEILRNHITLRD